MVLFWGLFGRTAIGNAISTNRTAYNTISGQLGPINWSVMKLIYQFIIWMNDRWICMCAKCRHLNWLVFISAVIMQLNVFTYCSTTVARWYISYFKCLPINMKIWKAFTFNRIWSILWFDCSCFTTKLYTHSHRIKQLIYDYINWIWHKNGISSYSTAASSFSPFIGLDPWQCFFFFFYIYWDEDKWF